MTGAGGASLIQAVVIQIDQQALGHMQIFGNSPWVVQDCNGGGSLRIRCLAYKPGKRGRCGWGLG